MVTVTSLYICISYIYTYSYKFYYFSSFNSYCMSIFSVTCSMSLAYLLSILLLYSCFYTLHIPYSFYNLLFYIFYYIFIYFCTFIYFLYFPCVHLSCLIISHILFISSCTLLLILVPVYYHQCYASLIMSYILYISFS